MKKFFVIFLSLLLVLTGCTSQPKPETSVPSAGDKFGGEQTTAQESSKPAEESSKPAEESSEVSGGESSAPAQTGAFDGQYLLEQVFSTTDGVESQIYSYAESQEPMIYAEIAGTSFMMIGYDGSKNESTIDQATGKVDLTDDHLDATIADGMMIMVSTDNGNRYVFRQITGDEAASVKTDFEARAAAYEADNSSKPEESSKPEFSILHGKHRV